MPHAATRPADPAPATTSRAGGLGRALAATALGCGCALAAAQEAPRGLRRVTIEPTFEASVSHSHLQRNDSVNPSGDDLVVQLRPGLRVTGNSGRARGTLTYSLDAIHHSLDGVDADLQNSLNANFNLEAIENWLFVDASATLSQRSLSAFGQQSVPGSVQDNSNRVEVGTASVSPYLRGRLGDAARYELRLNAATTNARKSITSDSTTTGGSVNIDSASEGSLFGWGLQATQQRADFRAGPTTVSDRVSASVSARPDPDLTLTLRGGQEATDVVDSVRTTYNNWGAAVTWSPNPRTTASVDADKRYFGTSHHVVLQHRLPLSTFRFTSTEDVSGGSDPNGVGQPVTLYALYSNLLLSRFPDPIERDAAVRDLLLTLGQDGNTTVAGGFVTRGVTLQRRQDLGWTYSGRRATVSVQAFNSDITFLGASLPQQGSEPVRQSGYTTSASYRLTPPAAASLTGSRLVTRGSDTRPGNNLKSLTLGFTDQLGRRTSASLSARYSVFNSTSDAYRETSVTGSVAVRF